MPIATGRRAARGFTLIEIMVVLVIIAVMASVAMVSIGLLGEDREIERESERLTDAIALLQEQAELEGRDYGIWLETSRYEFQRFDALEQRWKPVEGDPALAPRELSPELSIELVIEGRPILLKKQANPDNRVPQLVAWGSGETTPYRLSLVRKGGARLALVGGLDGRIDIQRGDEKP
jgi:general secretion pathway protein H